VVWGKCATCFGCGDHTPIVPGCQREPSLAFARALADNVATYITALETYAAANPADDDQAKTS
jgi:hypothetical protein